MTDPMDRPPVGDYGSDRYDYIEIEAPDGIVPPTGFLANYLTPCPDCRANVFIRYGAPKPDWPESEGWVDVHGRTWFVAIAHDDPCPTLTKIEEQGTDG